MSTSFDTNFGGDTPGGGAAGFGDVGFSIGHVVDLGTMTGSTPAPGFYERLGHAYSMGLDGTLRSNSNLPGTECTIVNEVFGQSFQFGPLSRPCPQILDIGMGTTGTLTSRPIAWCQPENDGSVSLYMDSILGQSFTAPYLLANSGNQVFYDHTWQMLQMNILLTANIPGGPFPDSYLQVEGDVVVDGRLLISVPLFFTNIRIADMPNLSATFNTMQFTGNGFIGEAFAAQPRYYGTGTLTNGTQAYYIPHPANPKIAFTQGVNELVFRPNTNAREARMTQAVVEVPWRPLATDRQLRMTQGVVEIVKRNGAPGWNIYEA